MFTKKQIWALLIPLMVEQVLTSLMGTVDTVMVTNAGSAAISAVSLVDSLNVLVIFVFSAMATGAATLCAQYLGRKDTERANEVGRQLMLTVAVLSALITIFCILLRRDLLNLIFGKTERDVMENAVTYLLITAVSYPFIAIYNAGAALYRACGNSKLPLAVSTASNLINVAGNAILIFGFQMGVAGAALATLLSRIVSALALLALLRRPGREIVLRDYRRIRPSFPVIRDIVAIGVPTGIENGMFQFGKLAIQATVSTMGTTAIAAQAMTMVLEQLESNASLGIGLGMMTIVGQYIGAGRYDEARKSIKQLSWYGFAGIVLCCALMAVLVKPITWLAGMEADAAALTVRLTWIICLVKPFPWAFSFMPAYGMRAAGDVRYSMLVSTLSMWLFRVLVVILLEQTYHLGPIVVWIGMFIDWTVRGICYAARFHGDRWLHRNLIHS